MEQPERPKSTGAEASRRPSFLTTFIATGCYTGHLPWAPGTWGSLLGLLIALIPGCVSPPVLGSMIVAGFFAGVVTSARVADHVGHQLSKAAEFSKRLFQPGQHDVPDPSIVVIDEIVGMWIALFLQPATLLAFALAFVAFRAFDTLKPFPGRQLEKIPRGWGIMLDDVAAGIYANLATRVLLAVLTLVR